MGRLLPTPVLYNKQINIAIISGTHIINKIKFSNPGYQFLLVFHSNNTSHANVAIIIKLFFSFSILSQIQKNFLQASIILLTLRHISIIIATIYCFLRRAINSTEYDSFFSSLGHYFIVGVNFYLNTAVELFFQSQKKTLYLKSPILKIQF